MMFTIPRTENVIQNLINQSDRISRVVSFFYKVESRSNCPKDIDWTDVEFVSSYVNNIVKSIKIQPWFVTNIIFTKDEMNTIIRWVDPDFNFDELFQRCDKYLEENSLN